MKKIFMLASAICFFSLLVSCSGNAAKEHEDSITKRDVTKDSIQVDTHKNASRVNGQRPVGDTLKTNKYK